MYPNAVKQTFKTHFGDAPSIIVRAPGRINLIGEHTDYNGGYVMPAAINNALYFAVSVRKDTECRFIAHDISEFFNIDLNNIEKSQTHQWANYLMGVLVEINHIKPHLLRGINVVFGGDLPSGGGVSSSAAMGNGIGFAVNELFNLHLSRIDLLKISQRSENNFVGMKCGIMDMFASMMGKENAVIHLDCNSLKYQYIPFNTLDYQLVLCNTTVKHTLLDSEYNTRRAECEEAVAILQKQTPSVKMLSDVKMSLLNKHKTALRAVVFKRCHYVISEISRVKKACQALKCNDFKALGALMFQTHEGLQHDYQVSCKELDFLVDKARHINGVLGARMMGGGFGGCTINLVKTDKVAAFIEEMKKAYQSAYNIALPCHVVTPKNGVEIMI